MKYIRTKDGVYDANLSFYLGNTDSGNKTVIATDGKVGVIISEADTIEELCDCFIEVGLGNPMVVTWEYVLNDEDRRNFDVYGAISTAKGIIYVAKLNDEGELELL